MDTSQFLPLPAAAFHILVALAREERHGYGIMRAIDEDTEGEVRIGPGTMYGTLKRLLDTGLVEEGAERLDALNGDRRRYYRLTSLGREVARAEAKRLSTAVRLAQAANLLKPGRTA
jgi:DNA-binding PadR family transcriptional regulator